MWRGKARPALNALLASVSLDTQQRERIFAEVRWRSASVSVRVDQNRFYASLVANANAAFSVSVSV